ncbi:MAG: hypothetical protein ACRBF0_08765 [Calditrichia bacterium]
MSLIVSEEALFLRLLIGKLAEELNTQRKISNAERKVLHQTEWKSSNFTLEDLSLLEVSISGIADSIIYKGKRSRPEEAVELLESFAIEQQPLLRGKFPELETQFPQIVEHVLKLDYFRLLTLEYIRRYQIGKRS